jgi:tryptophan-rich sensory protein
MIETTQESARPRGLKALLGFGALCAGAAALGSLTMIGRGSPSKSWYRLLAKPPAQPPSAVFGPVWTVLYGLIAYSGYRVYKAPSSPQRTRALAAWGTQLALNAAWTPLFFGAQKPTIALVDIGVLDASVLAYTLLARKVDKRAAVAVLPYLGWIGFATYLNAGIVAKN